MIDGKTARERDKLERERERTEPSIVPREEKRIRTGVVSFLGICQSVPNPTTCTTITGQLSFSSQKENLRLLSVYCQVLLSSTAYLFSSCSAYAFTHFWRFVRFSLSLSLSLHERLNGIATSFFPLSVKGVKWNLSHLSTHLIERNRDSARAFRCFEMLEGN